MSDTLKKMFENQKMFNNRVGVPTDRELTDEELTQWLGHMIAAISNELEETREWTHWKWWKEYTEPIDKNKIKVELIDIWHFLMSACMFCGMDADEFVDMYQRKLALNNKRQDVGYNDQYEKVDSDGLEDNDKI